MSLIPDNHPLWKEWEGQRVTVLTAENNWTSGTLVLLEDDLIRIDETEQWGAKPFLRVHFLRRDQVLKVSLVNPQLPMVGGV